jgi:hypothetical protein
MLRLKQLWNSDKKLADYIKELNPKRILLPFGHGLGDNIMFLNVLDKLAELYPDIEFTLALQKGLGFEELEPDIIGNNKKVVYSSDLSYKEHNPEYDIIADIDFPMTEGHTEYTKAEGCCLNELGIESVCGHKRITCGQSKLVGVMFNITCLPDSANTPEPIAQKIWNEILESNNIPLETCQQHVFFNPINKKYSFVDRDIRNIPARVSTLAGVIQNCKAYITCVTGNFHLALSILPPERICLLERDFLAPSFTKLDIKRVNVNDYQDGVIRDWLATL